MLVALTGGIGSGKSTVLRIFESLGAQVAYTDLIVHKIYEEDKQLHAIMLDRWGQKVFKNSLPHRPTIAEIVFNNKQELEWLNSVMHPLVKTVIQSLDSTDLHLVAVPLLYEVNWQNEFQQTVSVWCDEDIQNERLLARGWKQDEVCARLSAQLHQDEKLTRSNYGIINNWSIDFLKNQCQKIYKLLQDKGPT
ncbi:MAG: dephospho-CoA kinase [Lentisphaeraceae bacterium]|nr:dephospho-CoA kinase [Lentisphaeraceae bacterium]